MAAPPNSMEKGLKDLQECDTMVQSATDIRKDLEKAQQELKKLHERIADLQTKKKHEDSKLRETNWPAIIAENLTTQLPGGGFAVTNEIVLLFKQVMGLDPKLPITKKEGAEILRFLNMNVMSPEDCDTFGVTLAPMQAAHLVLQYNKRPDQFDTFMGFKPTPSKIIQVVGAVGPAYPGCGEREYEWKTIYRSLPDQCSGPAQAAKFAKIDLSQFHEVEDERIQYRGSGTIYFYKSDRFLLKISLLTKEGEKSLILLPLEERSPVPSTCGGIAVEEDPSCYYRGGGGGGGSA